MIEAFELLEQDAKNPELFGCDAAVLLEKSAALQSLRSIPSRKQFRYQELANFRVSLHFFVDGKHICFFKLWNYEFEVAKKIVEMAGFRYGYTEDEISDAYSTYEYMRDNKLEINI